MSIAEVLGLTRSVTGRDVTEAEVIARDLLVRAADAEAEGRLTEAARLLDRAMEAEVGVAMARVARDMALRGTSAW